MMYKTNVVNKKYNDMTFLIKTNELDVSQYKFKQTTHFVLKKTELLPLNLHYTLSDIQSTIDKPKLLGLAVGDTLKC